MKRTTCVRCGAPKGKGRHFLTVAIVQSTTKLEFGVCENCGLALKDVVLLAFEFWKKTRPEPPADSTGGGKPEVIP